MKPRSSPTLAIASLIIGIGSLIVFLIALLATQRGEGWLSANQSGFDVVSGGLTLVVAIAAGWLLYRRSLAADELVLNAISAENGRQLSENLSLILAKSDAENMVGVMLAKLQIDNNTEPTSAILTQAIISQLRNRFHEDYEKFTKWQTNQDAPPPISTEFVSSSLQVLSSIFARRGIRDYAISIDHGCIARSTVRGSSNTSLSITQSIIYQSSFSKVRFREIVDAHVINFASFSNCMFPSTEFILLGAPIPGEKEPAKSRAFLKFENCSSIGDQNVTLNGRNISDADLQLSTFVFVKKEWVQIPDTDAPLHSSDPAK